MSATLEQIAIAAPIRHDWRLSEVEALFALPFNDLLFKAQSLHRVNFDPNEIQVSSLLSIKTGSCSEDCGYCPQSARYDADLNPEALLPLNAVLKAAEQAKQQGASRFCMGAAWRSPKDRDIERVVEMVQGVKALGMETCVTLGMLTDKQTTALKAGGLDYYNHNLDTSEDYYSEVITTRTYQDRLDTLSRVRDAGINVCCGESSAWASPRRIALSCCWNWQICQNTRKAYLSICWCRSKVLRCMVCLRWIHLCLSEP